MELGDKCPPCSCQVGACQSGIEPFGDCVRQLQGETVWHHCDECGLYAWKNNGTCINCARVARDTSKSAQDQRFAAMREGNLARHKEVDAVLDITPPPPVHPAERMLERVNNDIPPPRLTLEIYGQTVVWDDPAVVMQFVMQALGGKKS